MATAISYNFKAVDDAGRFFEGVLDAESKDAATDIIRGRGQLPVLIEPLVKSANVEVKLDFLNKRPNAADLAMFCQQLSTMLEAGIPISRALDTLAPEIKNKQLRAATEDLSLSVKQGVPLSRCMSEHPKVYPELLLSMVEAGELNGKQDESLKHMGEQFVKDNRIQRKVSGAMVYPMVLLTASIAAAVVMLVFIAPMFVSMFASSGQELPGVTKALMVLSDSLTNFWYLYIAGIAGAIWGFKLFSASSGGKHFLDEMKLKLPGVKGPISQIITARFARTFSTLLSSGVSMVNALEQATKTSNNMVVQDRMEDVIQGVQQGRALSEELGRTKLFPSIMIGMVSIGEETGAIDILLEKAANYYEEELEGAIAKLLAILEPLLILFMALVVGFLLVALMVPMVSMVAATG